MAQDKKSKKAIESELNKIMRNDIDIIEAHFVNNWKLIVGIGIAVVILIAIVLGIKQHMEQSENRGLIVLNTASTIETLETALSEYPNNPAAGTAGFRLAKLYADARNSVKCATALNLALTRVTDDKVLDRRLDAEGIIEISGDIAQAQAILQSVLSDSKVNARQRAQALYTLGRLATDRDVKMQYFVEVAGISTDDSNAAYYVLLAKSGMADLKNTK